MYTYTYKEVLILKKKTQVKFSPEQLVSATQLARNLSKHLNDALSYPLFIQRDQEVQWVLLSLDEYRKIVGEKGSDKMNMDDMVNPNTIGGVKKFYKIFHSWLDDNIIGREIKHISSENELNDHIKKNGKFGIVDELTAICWSGQGYYISWNRNGKHINRIDMACLELIKEYKDIYLEYSLKKITNEEADDFLISIGL
jgi:hypothetical protein